MQDELFPRTDFSLTPEAGRRAPRLWVRRLVIWREPGNIVRDIPLKPGLNIIWSPDPGTSETAPIGHGGGKTTFCRLLRYCLGEDSFAPAGQRRSMWDKFPKGHVGAEIMIDGRSWVVVRAIGDRRHDVVIEDGSFDSAFGEDAFPTGIAPLHEAIGGSIIGDAARLMPKAIGEAGAWEAALAWATRDQECRFGHHLDWRDPNTDSRSPVRGRSAEDRLAIVRALIGAFSVEEIAAQQRADNHAEEVKTLREELGRLDWQIGRTRGRLASALGGSAGADAGGELDAVGFKSMAEERLAKALNLKTDGATTDLARVRRDSNAASAEFRKLEANLNELTIRIEEKNKTLVFMRSQLPEAHALMTKEKNPICPICKVPVDKALADGCGISTATCDLGALQAEVAKLRDNIQSQKTEITGLENRQPALKSEIAVARQKLERLEQAVSKLEIALNDRSTTIRAAQRIVDESDGYADAVTERAKVSESLSKIEGKLEQAKGELVAHRSSASGVIRELSARFDAVLRELVPGEIRGEAKLDGNGLALKVEMGGDRSTAAIESLKVVAFDLAVLAMTIEGKTNLADFLVHDSPREADLGESIYRRLFKFAGKLEGFGPDPLFQYIISTTTQPPDEFCSEPWLRLTVRGAPAEERLLGVDL